MLIQENLLSYMKVSIAQQVHLYSCPFFVFDGQTFAIASKQKLSWVRIKTFLVTVYSLVLWLQLLKVKGEPAFIMLENMLFVIAFSVYNLSQWILLQRCSNYVEVFNMFLHFEKIHKKGKISE